jgi:hypothetical protein
MSKEEIDELMKDLDPLIEEEMARVYNLMVEEDYRNDRHQ